MTKKSYLAVCSCTHVCAQAGVMTFKNENNALLEVHGMDTSLLFHDLLSSCNLSKIFFCNLKDKDPILTNF